MSRPAKVTLNLEALAHNLAVIKHKAKNSKIWSVVKADAYGHGLSRLWPTLSKTDGFALIELDNAIMLREEGWLGPILLLEGFFKPEDVYLLERYSITTVVHSDWQLEAIDKAQLERPINIYLKLNSGMNRLGYRPEQYHQIIQRVKNIQNIGSITQMTHFANSDTGVNMDKQKHVIEQTMIDELPRCLANSAATLFYPETHYDWVRPGIILYGASPSGIWQDIASFNLKPVMTFSSEILSIQHVKKGEQIGYGSRYTASRDMRVGVVACGYADGYPRHAPDGTPILVNGHKTQLVGRISMDMLTIDVTDFADVTYGSSVELWGEHLPVDDVASACGTIGYELLCAIAPRVKVEIAKNGSYLSDFNRNNPVDNSQNQNKINTTFSDLNEGC
ncbi:alanine racemase [Proteus myxofaciens]|uniref:Alanine racemase n=1 Tax=Proteus myxofaciens ATCC 19692 TaxID=1354337 RepID=A0A198GMW5_9GAMM|nr:alanine racemase [Proteus myxofaciens]OAT37551.1 alanine racemase [Proteus myxofaciens ATCC 19692]